MTTESDAAPAPQIRSFAEFWPHYVGAHRQPLTRVLHYIGTSGAVLSVGSSLVTGNWRWLLAAPLVGYSAAWIGHFCVEGNRPASFGHPVYSLLADFKMLGLGLTGKMASEVKRLYDAP